MNLQPIEALQLANRKRRMALLVALVGTAWAAFFVARVAAARLEPWAALAGERWAAFLIPRAEEAVVPISEPMEEPSVGPVEVASLAAEPAARAPKRKTPAAKAEDLPTGVHLSAATVLRLANARAMPSAVAVPAEGNRPAGLRLSGVARLGVGLKDGDVLTHVAGTPVGAVPQVVSIVMTQRSKHAQSIGGLVWRGQHGFALNVEMPYPTAAAAAKQAPAGHSG
jgi:hypothetical protein